ncbi:MAG: hypothetical protein EZS28_041796, partial [Streblomastix strix]
MQSFSPHRDKQASKASIDPSDVEVLSTLILHLIGARDGSNDKIILSGAAIEPFIQMINSPEEQISKAGSKSLENLIAESKEIKNSLLTTGFIQTIKYILSNSIRIPDESLVSKQQPENAATSSLLTFSEILPEILNQSSYPYQHDFIISSQPSSSSSQQLIQAQHHKQEIPQSNHIKSCLLDILLKLVTTSEDLNPLQVLIPILEELKTNGEIEIKNKARKILTQLIGEGIIIS